MLDTQRYAKSRSHVQIKGNFIQPEQILSIIKDTYNAKQKHCLIDSPAGSAKTTAGLLALAQWAREENGIALFVCMNRDPVLQTRSDLQDESHPLYSSRDLIKAVTSPQDCPPQSTSGRVFVLTVDSAKGIGYKLSQIIRFITDSLPEGVVLKKAMFIDESHLLSTEQYRESFISFLNELGNFNPDIVSEVSATHYNFEGLKQYKFQHTTLQLQARNRMAFDICPIKGKYDIGSLALGAALKAWKDGFKFIFVRMQSKKQLRAVAKELRKRTKLPETHFYLAFSDVDKRKDIRKQSLLTSSPNLPIFIFATSVFDQAVSLNTKANRGKFIYLASPSGSDSWKGVLPHSPYQLGMRGRKIKSIDVLVIVPSFLLNGNGGDLKSLYAKHSKLAELEKDLREKDITSNEEAEHIKIKAQGRKPKLKSGIFASGKAKHLYTFANKEGNIEVSKMLLRYNSLKDLGEAMNLETYKKLLYDFTEAPILEVSKKSVCEDVILDTGGVDKEDVELYMSSCKGVNLYNRAQEKYFYSQSMQMKAGLVKAFGAELGEWKPDDISEFQPLSFAEATAENDFFINLAQLSSSGLKTDNYPSVLERSSEGLMSLSKINSYVSNVSKALNIAMQFDLNRQAREYYDYYISMLRTSPRKQANAVGADLSIAVGRWLEDYLISLKQDEQSELNDKKALIEKELKDATDKSKKQNAKRKLKNLEKKVKEINAGAVYASRNATIEIFEKEAQKGSIDLPAYVKISEAVSRITFMLDYLFIVPEKKEKRSGRKRIKLCKLSARNYAEVLIDFLMFDDIEAIEHAKKAVEDRVNEIKEVKAEIESEDKRESNISFIDYSIDPEPLQIDNNNFSFSEDMQIDQVPF